MDTVGEAWGRRRTVHDPRIANSISARLQRLKTRATGPKREVPEKNARYLKKTRATGPKRELRDENASYLKKKRELPDQNASYLKKTRAT